MKLKLKEIIRYKRFWTDKKYILWQFQSRMGYHLNLENPMTFNEKNNWRKLFDRRPIYITMVDKYKAKRFIADRVGEEYTFKLLGTWDKPQDIDLSKLPDQFVLKTNHAGGVIICRNKCSFDLGKAVSELKETLRYNYFLPNREWPYKNVPRKIIAEEYMGEGLIDYKTYCFNGLPKYIFVWVNKSREDGRKPMAYFAGAYTFGWEKSNITIDYPTTDDIISRPECLDKLQEITAKISSGFPFVRVDCYIIDNQVYVGEMTLFPWSGYMKFKDDTDEIFGTYEELGTDKEL